MLIVRFDLSFTTYNVIEETRGESSFFYLVDTLQTHPATGFVPLPLLELPHCHDYEAVNYDRHKDIVRAEQDAVLRMARRNIGKLDYSHDPELSQLNPFNP